MVARMSKGANREDCAVGPAQGEGLGGAAPRPPPHFMKKRKEKKRNTYFQIKRIFDGIRIFDWQT